MKILLKKTRRAAEIWREKGFSGVGRQLRQLYEKRRTEKIYPLWIKKFDALTDRQRDEIRRKIGEFKNQPLISVVMPVYNVEEKWLRLCVESVTNQIYENWEFCIADDCSPSPHIRRVLEEYAQRDKRIKIVFRRANGHISAASNSALELATGEYAALLDHDDELAETALYHVAATINDAPETAMIYSDEDMIDERGRRYSPKFKPDWSRDLFYSLNLITHLSVYRTEILRKIGGFRVGLEGSQDYDLALRVIEQISEKNIRHIPRILYHWRAICGSVALSGDEKPYAHERARTAIRAHLERTGKRAKVSRTTFNLHRVSYDLPLPLPKVSLIMLGDENYAAAEKAVKTFAEATDYENLEITVICSARIKKLFDAESFPAKLRTIICDDSSEAEKYNQAVRQTDGEVLCFVNENLLPASKDWLRELVGFALQTEVGAAGAKITGADETILHGGIILGVNGLIGYAHQGLPRELGGNFGRAQVVNNFSAAAIDCLATRREVFQRFGGFDAGIFPNRLFDVDFCLKLREKNLRIVWTPYAELLQTDRHKPLNLQKKPTAAERDCFKLKWRDLIERDPFYNPNFSRRRSFTIDL